MKQKSHLMRFTICCLLLACILTGCTQEASSAADSSGEPKAAGNTISVKMEIPKITEVSLGTMFNRIHGVLPYGDGVTVVGSKDGEIRILNMDQNGNHADSVPLKMSDQNYMVYDVGTDHDQSVCVLIKAGTDGVKLLKYDHQGALLTEQKIDGTKNLLRGPVSIEREKDILWNTEEIVVCGKEGSVIYTPFSPNEEIRTITTDEHQKCHVFVMEQNKVKLCLFDPDTGKAEERPVSEEISLPSYTRCESAAGTVYFNTDEYLMEYKEEKDSLTKRFEWGALSGGQINQFIEIEKNRFACTDAITASVYLITTVEKTTERKTITIGALRDVSLGKLERFASYFNMHNEEYYAEIKYYDEPDILRAEWVTKDVPCVVNVPYMDIPQNEKLFVDLLPYLERGDEITKDDITESMLRSFLTGEKLFVIPSTVQIETVYARREDVGDDPGWTMEEMKALLSEKGDSYLAFPRWLTPTELMRWFRSSDLGRFVDWEKAECYFDSRAFIDELQFCLENAPEVVQFSPDHKTGVHDSDVLLGPDSIQAIKNFPPIIRYAFDGAALTFIGFPNADGNNGSYFAEESTGLIMGVPQNSPDPEGAWAVIKTMLSEDWQREEDRIPVNRHVLEERMLGLKEDDQYTEKPLTDEEISDCWELINGIEIFLREDAIISKIIIEEAESYFSGDKTAEEAAKIIQSRVTLYLQEQYQ